MHMIKYMYAIVNICMYVCMYIYISISYTDNAKSGLINTIILINALPSPKICQYYFPLGPKLPSQ